MLAQMGDAYSGGQVVRGERLQGRFRRDLATWWDDGWDLLLTPTTASPPPLVGELVPSAEDPSRGFLGSVPYAAFTSVFNVTGQPAISLPGPPTPEGLPVGVQLVAAYGREDLLLRVASQLEVDLDWAATRAPLHP
jgi:amidase